MIQIRTALLAAMLCGAALPVMAGAPSSLSVSDCWIRTLPGDLPAGGYFKVTNAGDQATKLVGVSTTAYSMSMLHRTLNQGGVSNMVMVKQIPVPAHGTLTFAPGDYHVMLEKPKEAVKVGMSIPMIFTFSHGDNVTAQCVIKGATAMGY